MLCYFFFFFEIVLLLYFAYITVIGNYTTTLESIVMRKWRIPIIFLLFFVNFGNSQFVRAETIDSEVIAEKTVVQSSSELENSTENNSSLNDKETQETTSTEGDLLDREDNIDENERADVEEETAHTRSAVNQTYDGQWMIVNTLSELQTALKDKEPYIKLASSQEDFVIGSANVPITADVTIDGNNRQISYTGGRAFNSSTANLTITLQNMTFGSPDYTLSASGLYGIMQSDSATQLHIENVNYYSSTTAQPFYLRHLNSKIYFHGTNRFMQQKADGSVATGQEFAECNNFEFVAGSHTTIVQNTNDALGSLWMPSNPSSITVGEEAEADITSNHNFIYCDGTNNSVITLGKNSKFSVKGTNADKGYFYYFDKPAFITVGEGAEFSVAYPHFMKLAAGSAIKFLPDSIGNFDISQDESVFDRGVGTNSTFEIDNAKQIRFKAKAGTTYNPIGFSSSSSIFSFSAFGEDTDRYDVVTDEAILPQKLTPQCDNGTWNVTTNTISRSVGLRTPDFTAEEKTTLKNAESITLNRLNQPVELLKVDQEIATHEATFKLSDYQLHGNDNLIKEVDFKLYSKETESPETENEGFVDYQTANLDSTVTFSDLKDRTEYWLYVRIVCDPDSQSSQWLKIPFKTEQEMINVSFPVEVAFYSEKSEGQQKIREAKEYQIENHSSFPVTVQATDFQELSNPTGINLLPKADATNKKDLLLNLTEGNQSIGVLTKSLKDAPLNFEELAGYSSTKLGFSGIYYGDEKTKHQVQYRLTMTAERKD